MKASFLVASIIYSTFLLHQATFASEPQLDPTGDDAVIQFEMQRQQREAAIYNKMNQSNPMSSSFDKNKIPLQNLLNQPKLQNTLNYFESPYFLGELEKIRSNPNRWFLLYAQLGWFVAVVFFRAWRRSKLTSENWLRLIWLKLYTCIVYMAVASVLIPQAFLGSGYLQFLWTTIQFLTKTFSA